jgi:hypothetical protein
MTQARLWLESTATVDSESAVAGLQGPVAGDTKLQLRHSHAGCPIQTSCGTQFKNGKMLAKKENKCLCRKMRHSDP